MYALLFRAFGYDNFLQGRSGCGVFLNNTLGLTRKILRKTARGTVERENGFLLLLHTPSRPYDVVLEREGVFQLQAAQVAVIGTALGIRLYIVNKTTC